MTSVEYAEPAAHDSPGDDEVESWWERTFGPLTAAKLIVLLIAVLFLGASAGYAYRSSEDAAPSEADVGFLRDMSTHHSQAVVIARTALASDLPPEVATFAEEVVVQQQFELGLMQATLYRFGVDPTGEGTAMGWMGMSVPEDEMPGLASQAEIDELESLEGDEAAALFFALMSRHHLGGAHMAEAAAARARDPWVVDLSERMGRSQRTEVQEYERTRARLGIGVPDGYSDTPEVPLPEPDAADDYRNLVTYVLLGIGAAALVTVAWRVSRRRPEGADEPTDDG